MNQIEKLIQRFELRPHPEGGYFKETYRAAMQIGPEALGPEFSGKRNCSTCIYFLLTAASFSSFHKIRQDEIWHFYKGSSLILHLISPRGNYSNVIIGNDLEAGQIPQFIVPKDHWFSAAVNSENGYSLVGCTVAPGFDFDDFHLGKRSELISKFPQHRNIIEAFTRG